MAKPSKAGLPKTNPPKATLLQKVAHETPGDYYHYTCAKCGDELVVLVILDGHVHVRASMCQSERSMGATEREAKFGKDVLAEIEALVAAKEPETLIPDPEPVIPGAPGGPSLVFDQSVASQEAENAAS